jgi:hypothetical protein
MQFTNQKDRPEKRLSKFTLSPEHIEGIKATAIKVGIIRCTLLLYQLSKRPTFPNKSVNPEQKKNKVSPIPPPVAAIFAHSG